MIRIRRLKDRLSSIGLVSIGLALCFCLTAQIPSSAQSESEVRATGTNVTILTTQLPETLTTNTQLSGLTVVKIEPLKAIGTNIVHVLLDEGHAPQSAITILSSAYPHTKFELLEDFENGDIVIPSEVQ